MNTAGVVLPLHYRVVLRDGAHREAGNADTVEHAGMRS
jgi:hypothetical protein